MNAALKSLFSRILEDNKYRIMRICKAYSQNKEDQRDLLQEVALNIWKSLPSFRQGATYDTWVYRISLNVCMQYAMKLNREKRVRVDIEGIEIFDDSTDLQKNLEHDEKANILVNVLRISMMPRNHWYYFSLKTFLTKQYPK